MTTANGLSTNDDGSNKIRSCSQNTGAWTEETTQPERNLIDVSR